EFCTRCNHCLDVIYLNIKITRKPSNLLFYGLEMKTNYLFAQPTQARHHPQLLMLRQARV
ncbi:hypothetical protein, partial [Acinetobacter oleivorans]|uniref:hypothetical protein n=1 Tax=Acinetobacter oleivorans TaxID=1148157 RepID=UPI001C2ECF94